MFLFSSVLFCCCLFFFCQIVNNVQADGVVFSRQILPLYRHVFPRHGVGWAIRTLSLYLSWSASTGVLAKWCTYWACKWSPGYPSEREVHLPLLGLRFLLFFQEANFRRPVWMLANWTQLTARLPCAISRDFVATLTNHEVLLMNFKICYLPLVLLETTSFEKILTV